MFEFNNKRMGIPTSLVFENFYLKSIEQFILKLNLLRCIDRRNIDFLYRIKFLVIALGMHYILLNFLTTIYRISEN